MPGAKRTTPEIYVVRLVTSDDKPGPATVSSSRTGSAATAAVTATPAFIRPIACTLTITDTG